ncbi:type I-C CRISPR-associated protein Cas8c/Csd1 [Kitasatospora griseola]|uniref:type I-C CRISPR-associated protein Cas8c/Csd1 n=1 Tax=Kitasatospora griseola TaxID=2064 RepID=UPI0016703F40|nr:type I-C CRISPR-associated protein Cas8c/Csd1 [Kitasatospora griseola]GGR09242.1 CRISPR-associated Csd1 family protein [Kitasatospora griseola]
MLLQRLAEQAERLEGLPPEFYRYRQIDWALVITTDGAAPSLADRRPPPKSRGEATVEAVPYVQRSGTRVPPFLLVDTAEFVLGRARGEGDEQGPSEKDVAEAARRRGEYLALLRRWADEVPDDPSAGLVLEVLTRGLAESEVPPEVDARHTVGVLVDGRWLHERASVRELWARVVRERKGAGGAQQELCLVCGEPGDLLSTIPEPIKKGAIPSTGGSNEAQLVSVNSPAQGRGGAVKLVNTPVCDRCGSRSMAAVNTMLASGRHRRSLSDGVLLWWTREPVDEPLIELIDDNDPDPDAVAHLIDTLHHTPDPAAAGRVDPNDFYALTLGLNNARTVVREWLDVPLHTVKANLGAWFEDHGVHDGRRGTTRYLPLWHLTLAAGRHNGTQYVKGTAPHGIERELLHSALRRTPPPARLLPLLLQRIRADHRIDAPRTALLRLALNRSHDRTDRPMPRLDSDSTDPAYLCGRAFAVLEAIQAAALPDVKATIGDKYFGTAMTAPAAVLANLRHGANAHLKRLRRDKPGAHAALSERLAQVLGALTDDPPTHLSPREQARFVIGYEQQRAADFAAKAVATAAKAAAKAAKTAANTPDEQPS